MSSRALIGQTENDGSITFVEVYFDGYLAHTGVLLDRYWNDEDRVRSLIANGKISSLGSELGEKHDGTAFPPAKGCENYTVFYSRDRNVAPVDTSAVSVPTRGEMVRPDVHYRYLFDQGRWLVSVKDTDFRPLTEILREVSMTITIMDECDDGTFILSADWNEEPRDWDTPTGKVGELVDFLNDHAGSQGEGWDFVINKMDDLRIHVMQPSAVVALKLRYGIEDHESREAAQ